MMLLGYYNSDGSFIPFVEYYQSAVVNGVAFVDINQYDPIKNTLFYIDLLNYDTAPITVRMVFNFTYLYATFDFPEELTLVKFENDTNSGITTMVFVIPPLSNISQSISIDRTSPFEFCSLTITVEWGQGNVSSIPDNYIYSIPFTGNGMAQYYQNTSQLMQCAYFTGINGNAVAARSGVVSYIDSTHFSVYIYQPGDGTLAIYSSGTPTTINVTFDQTLMEGDVIFINISSLYFCVSKASDSLLSSNTSTVFQESFDIRFIQFFDSEYPNGFYINNTSPKNITGYLDRNTYINSENNSVVINSTGYYNNITSNNSSLSLVNAVIFISGNAEFVNSTLQINSSSIDIKGNFTLSDVPVYMSLDSQLNVDGCLNINNSTDLTINLKDSTPTNGEKITLINSSCINGRFQSVKIIGMQVSDCISIINNYTSTQFAIVLSTAKCNNQVSFLTWLVPVCIAIPVLMIIGGVILLIRKKKKRKERNEKI